MKVRVFAVVLFFISLTYSELDGFYRTHQISNYITASPIQKFYLDLRTVIEPEGSVFVTSNYGFGKFVSVGISLGVQQLVSRDEKRFLSPAVSAKYTLLPENENRPSIALGYFGKSRNFFHDSIYTPHYFKDPGFFLAITKYYLLKSMPVGLHSGLSYDVFENKFFEQYTYLDSNSSRINHNNVANVYVALEWSVVPFLSINAIYDFAFNDNLTYHPLEGYLHTNLTFKVSSVYFSLDFKDIFKNKVIYYNEQGQLLPKEKSPKNIVTELRVLYLQQI